MTSRRRSSATADDVLELFPLEPPRPAPAPTGDLVADIAAEQRARAARESAPPARRRAAKAAPAPMHDAIDPPVMAVDPYARVSAAVERAVEAALDGGTFGAYAPLDVALPADDAIPGATPAAAVPVSMLTQTLKEVVEGAFMPLWVRGEVSDFKAHRNGHWYFTLRDEAAQVRCVVWARDARRMPAPPDDGMQIVALGQMGVYAARADVQLVVKSMEAQGDGLWRKALELTRRRLEADGLLDPARKRALPLLPRRVAVVTSPDGAALHDIVAVVRRRCPTVELVIVPAKVQGDGAAEELCAALERVGRWRDVDVVIVGRGGGAREDLWAFNDERLARAVAACPVPIVSAVGHEVDVTLCDLVADLRAPTPSAAAESVVPVLDEQRAIVAAHAEALRGAIEHRLARADDALARVRQDLEAGAQRVVERRQAALQMAAGRLHALSPLATLGRGYAVARDGDGRSLSTIADFAPGAPFELLVRDGRVRATTDATEPTPLIGESA